MGILIAIAAIYLIGIFLFFVYAAGMNKGWNNSYDIVGSLGYAAKWPWTLLRLAMKGRRS